MEQNKTGKYLKYAIGEIVLVVIGILIALSINNWNEGRLEGLKEIDILLEIKESLMEDINGNKANIQNQSKRIADIKELIIFLESNLKYSDTLNKYFGSASHLESFEINASAYEGLKNSGFELLTSRSLKNEITSYYDVETKHRYVIVDRLNIEQRNSVDQFKWKIRQTYEGAQEMFNFYVAKQGRFYINYLHSRISWKTNFIDDILTPNFIQAEKLVASIDEELQTLND